MSSIASAQRVPLSTDHLRDAIKSYGDMFDRCLAEIPKVGKAGEKWGESLSNFSAGRLPCSPEAKFSWRREETALYIGFRKTRSSLEDLERIFRETIAALSRPPIDSETFHTLEALGCKVALIQQVMDCQNNAIPKLHILADRVNQTKERLDREMKQAAATLNTALIPLRYPSTLSKISYYAHPLAHTSKMALDEEIREMGLELPRSGSTDSIVHAEGPPAQDPQKQVQLNGELKQFEELLAQLQKLVDQKEGVPG